MERVYPEGLQKTGNNAEIPSGMTIADSWGMKANASTLQRPPHTSDDDRALDAREMTSPHGADRNDAMNRRDGARNRVEALLRAHPSIVHEIE
jgi:hypothetical protein